MLKGGTHMQELMKKYRARLVKEGVIKASLYAAVVAFAALAVCAVVFWFTGFRMVWVGAIVFAAVLLIAAPVIYFAAFRPTEKSVARRVDKDLGLDERMVTMLELRGNSEIIACAQRANAVSALRAASNAGIKKVAITVGSAALVVGIGIAAVLGTGMTTVSALSATGVIPSGKDLLSGAAAAPRQYTVTYLVEGVGTLKGNVSPITQTDPVSGDILVTGYEQIVTEGEISAAVWAVPGADETGDYYFVGWSDGVTVPYRTVSDLTADVTITAVFAPVGDELGDGSEDIPPIPGFSEDGDSSDNGGGINKPAPPEDNEGKEENNGSGDGAGGSSNPAFQVNDGQTDYGGSVFENASDQAQDAISSDDSIPDDLVGIIGDYMDIIKR